MRNWFFSLLFASFCFGCESNTRHSTDADVVNMTQGEMLYTRYCRACHGIDGTKQFSGAFDLKNSTLNQMEMMEVIINGRNQMISYKKVLTESEVGSIIEHIQGFQ